MLPVTVVVAAAAFCLTLQPLPSPAFHSRVINLCAENLVSVCVLYWLSGGNSPLPFIISNSLELETNGVLQSLFLLSMCKFSSNGPYQDLKDSKKWNIFWIMIQIWARFTEWMLLIDIKFLLQSLIDPRGIFKIPLACHSHDTIASQMMGIHQLMLHYYNDNCKMMGTVRYQLGSM